MSWFNNDAGFAQTSSKKYTKRFWMPNDSERLITFIDTPIIDLEGIKVQTPFKYNEYQIQLNGSWKNWFTQPIDPTEDVLKEMGYKAAKVAVLTAIDHAEWTDRNGTTHKDQLCLYVVKRSSQVWKQIERFMERGMDLSGQTFLVSRMGDKSPGTGSMLEKHSENFNLREGDVPFNYLEILKPKSKSDLEALFNPNANDPFKQGQQSSNSFGNTNHNGWGSQPSEPANNWESPFSKQSQPSSQEARVFGSTSGNNGNDPIPF